MRMRIAPSSSYAVPSSTSRRASSFARSMHVELERRLTVPLDAEPAQRALDLLDRLLDLAARVGVLDPQQALAAAAAREEPVEEEGAHTADVEEPGRRRRHADADGHERSSVVAMLFGAHVSAAGGISKAIDRVEEIGGNAVQVFTQSPRMWRPTAHTDRRRSRASASVAGRRECKAVSCHALYLVNLASRDARRARELARGAAGDDADGRRDRRRGGRLPRRLAPRATGSTTPSSSSSRRCASSSS